MYNVFELWWVGKQKEFLLCTVHSKIYTAHTMLWFGTDQDTSFTNPTVSLFYFCSQWCIVGYGTDASWDLLISSIWPINIFYFLHLGHQCLWGYPEEYEGKYEVEEVLPWGGISVIFSFYASISRTSVPSHEI